MASPIRRGYGEALTNGERIFISRNTNNNLNKGDVGAYHCHKANASPQATKKMWVFSRERRGEEVRRPKSGFYQTCFQDLNGICAVVVHRKILNGGQFLFFSY